MLGAAERWALVAEHRDWLVDYLRSRCADVADAEDCAHEAMLRAVRIPELDATHLRGLLSTIGRNLATDTHRARARQRRASLRMAHPPSEPVEALVIDRAEARFLARKAAFLSELERAALRGRLDGYRPAETAVGLGLPAKTVHLALSRARTQLRAAALVTAAAAVWLRRLARSAGGAPVAVAAAATLFLIVDGGLQTSNNPGGNHAAPTPRTQAVGNLQERPAAPTPAPQALGRGSTTAVQAPQTSPTGPAPAPRPTPVTVASVPVPGNNGAVSVTRSKPTEPLTTSLQSCLQPGAISLDPHNLGCPP
ncbi:MAG: hypothetical protein NVSMB29_08610 [Candidatus Dormibacteria bacterium]